MSVGCQIINVHSYIGREDVFHIFRVSECIWGIMCVRMYCMYVGCRIGICTCVYWV